MQFFTLAAFAIFAFARASPLDTRGTIAARGLVQSYGTIAPAQQQQYVASHCSELTPAIISTVAAQPDVAAAMNANGISVADVVVYVYEVCGN
ncbi:hypothetical protein FB451DRAFT_1387991 [Mycena latifolia]|nr:hypothetical protein FB451DRAFT_1387991 [Mycena latifolia]